MIFSVLVIGFELVGCSKEEYEHYKIDDANLIKYYYGNNEGQPNAYVFYDDAFLYQLNKTDYIKLYDIEGYYTTEFLNDKHNSSEYIYQNNEKLYFIKNNHKSILKFTLDGKNTKIEEITFDITNINPKPDNFGLSGYLEANEEEMIVYGTIYYINFIEMGIHYYYYVTLKCSLTDYKCESLSDIDLYVN